MTADKKSSGVVIIGGGHAGGRTAERLRHWGFVGPIDVVGLEQDLPYERPPLSKDALTAPAFPANAYLLSPERWGELNVRFHLGTAATAIDRSSKTVRLSDGRRLSYRKLVLATGLKPRRLAVLDHVLSRVCYLRSSSDAATLRSRISHGTRIILVGAGLIGLEVAASASKLGADVTVVEAAERPLSRLLPPRIADWLTEVHGRAGVRILCGRQISSSVLTDRDAQITLDNGTQLTADLIVVGIGGVPNDELARDAGLKIGNGIAVNDFAQTSDPNIFAVGDIAFHINPIFGVGWRLESWKNAEDLAAIAASFICGNPTPYSEVPWFWTDQYDLNIQVAGVLDGNTLFLERGVIGQRGYLAYLIDRERLAGAIGIGSGRDIRIARETIKAGGKVDLAELRRLGFIAPQETALGSKRFAS